VSVLLWAQVSKAGPSQPDEAQKQKVLHKIARDWIRVGTKQYERSFYKQAEQSFFQAVEYQQYLTTDERERLSNFLEKTYKAELKREHILEQIKDANELVGRGQPGKAKSKLEKFKDSEFLTETERHKVAVVLSKLKTQLNQRTTEISKLYNHSVRLYLTGRLEEARQGFIEVAKSGLLMAPAGKSAEDYLVKIDNILVRRIRLSTTAQAEPQKKRPEPAVTAIEDKLLGSQTKASSQHQQQADEQPDTASVAKPLSDSESSNRRKSILRSYAKAVVNDAVAKAQVYMEQGQFDKAEAAIKTAGAIISKNRAHLGDKLFRQFNDKLAKLRVKINRKQAGQNP
jgi:tetratricopeptide (TPR) repeat protein